MNLSEAIDHINLNYKQELVLADEYDYLQNDFVKRPNPKFLYRGEKIYPITNSSYHRLSNTEQIEIKNYAQELAIHLTLEFENLVDRSNPMYQPLLNKVGGWLQHYGIPVMSLDFTEDPEVAAFFASYKNYSTRGRIFIIDTNELIEKEKIIHFNDGRAKRYTLQKAWSLRMYNDKPDLQNSLDFKTEIVEFEVRNEDINHFENKSLLNTQNDEISNCIIDYIEKIPGDKNTYLHNLLSKIKKELIEKQTW